MDKPSDEVANGDKMEDLDLEHEGDHNDDIVEDHGFSGSRGHVIRARKYAQKSRRAHHHKTRRHMDKPSDEVANGDKMEDLDLEHEGDHNDDIVEDHGFSGSRGHVIRARKYAQKNRRAHHHKTRRHMDKPSDEVANGDKMEDLDLEHEGDHNDDIVEDHGFSGSRGHVIRARKYAQNDAKSLH